MNAGSLVLHDDSLHCSLLNFQFIEFQKFSEYLLICSKSWQLVAEELHEAGGACEAAAVEHSDKARRPARKGNHPVGIFIIISAR